MSPTRLHIGALALAVSLLSACGGDDDGTTTPPTASPPPPAQAATVTITGKLTAPDATTPIANALVYVKDSSTPQAATSAGPLAAALACGTPPTASWASACTGADGSFTIAANVPASPTLVAVKGAFTQEKTLTIGGNGPVNVGTVALTAASAAKFAVVTGSYDRIQDVLAKLGYGQVQDGVLVNGSESFVQYDGDGSLPDTYAAVDKLFVDGDADGKADIFKYSVVFFNCGLDEALLDTPQNIATLRAYVEGGGRIYASDQAYDIVEQVFPAYVDFLGADGVAADQPESPGAAEEGEGGITVNATVDASLAAWLQGVTCADGPCVANGTAHVEGFLSGWAVMAGLHPAQAANVKTWVTGPVTFNGQATPVDKPLTVSFPAGQGRVTYTSYHTEPGNGTGGFLPQERILQFLVFEL